MEYKYFYLAIRKNADGMKFISEEGWVIVSEDELRMQAQGEADSKAETPDEMLNDLISFWNNLSYEDTQFVYSKKPFPSEEIESLLGE